MIRYQIPFPVFETLPILSKSDLNIAKAEIDQYMTDVYTDRYGNKRSKFQEITTNLEMSHQLKWKLKNVLNSDKISNAFSKQYELLSYHPALIPKDIERLVYFDNASFPGDFIRATEYFVKNHRTNIKDFDWRASSLIGSIKKTEGSESDAAREKGESKEVEAPLEDRYFLYQNFPYRWTMNPRNNGDVSDYNNTKNLEQQLGKQVDLYTSDLGFDVSSDYSSQEEQHIQANYGQIIQGLVVLKPGGSMITKQFTFFEERTRLLLFILSKIFERVNIDKPETSKPDNSEVYIVCINKSSDKKVGRYEALLLKQMKEWSSNTVNLDEIGTIEGVSLSKIKHQYALFEDSLNIVSTEIYSRQVEKIRDNIRRYKEIQGVKEVRGEKRSRGKSQYPDFSVVINDWIKRVNISKIKDPLPVTGTRFGGHNATEIKEVRDLQHIDISIIGRTVSDPLVYKLLTSCGDLFWGYHLAKHGINISEFQKLNKNILKWKDEKNEKNERNEKNEKNNKKKPKNNNILVEFTRLKYIQKMDTLSKKSYEFHNILERFLIAYANYNHNETDPIFGDYTEIPEISDKFTSECKEKNITDVKIDDIYGIVDEMKRGLGNITPNGDKGSIQNNIVKYSTFSKSFSRDRLDILRHKCDDVNVIRCILRYECLLPRGQQWSLPFNFYKKAVDIHGKERILECFASPLNSQMIKLGGRFCSLFYDTDKDFGSVGSFFDYTPDENDVLIVNPPFVPSILESSVDRCINKMSNTSNTSNTCIIIVPAWRDANFHKELVKHATHQYNCKRGEYYYEDGDGNRINAKFDSTLFILRGGKSSDYDSLFESLK